MNKVLPTLFAALFISSCSDNRWTEQDQKEWDNGYDNGYQGKNLNKPLESYSNNFIDGYEWGDALGDCEFYQLKGDWDSFTRDDCAEEFNLDYPNTKNIRQGNYYTRFSSCLGPRDTWHNCLGYYVSPHGGYPKIYAKFFKGHAQGYGHISTGSYTYHGNIQYNMAHGEGVRIYKNGSVYCKTFLNGRRHGDCIQYYANGKPQFYVKYYKGVVKSQRRAR